MECSDLDKELEGMVDNGLVRLDARMREHVDTCETCWKKLVAVRWKVAETTKDLKELKKFLGKDFIYGCDSSWELAKDWNATKRESTESVLDFYKYTPWYIYNLTLWEACGQRPQYVRNATQLLKSHTIKSVLDFGAGVGTDALKLSALGLNVETYEINIRCNRYMEWRKKHRNLDIVIHTETSTIGKEFDLLWGMDVIEHLQDPVATLSPFLRRTRLFIYDTEYSGYSGGRHPFHFQHNEAELQKAWRDLGFVQIANRRKGTNIRVFARPLIASHHNRGS